MHNRSITRILTLVLFTVFLSACGGGSGNNDGPLTIDTTSRKAFDKSLERVRNELTSSELEAFDSAVAFLEHSDSTMTDLMQGNVPTNNIEAANSGKRLYNLMNGKTAEEIIDIAAQEMQDMESTLAPVENSGGLRLDY